MWNGYFLFSMGFHGELVLSRKIKIFILFIYFVFWKISLPELDLFRQQFILQIFAAVNRNEKFTCSNLPYFLCMFF